MATFNQEDITAITDCITECIALPFGGYAYKVTTEGEPERLLNKIDFIKEGGKGGAIETVEETKKLLDDAKREVSIQAAKVIAARNMNVKGIPGTGKITMKEIKQVITVFLFFLMSFTGMFAQECCPFQSLL